MTETDSPRATYAAAGVDIAAGAQAVTALKPHAERARRSEVLGAVGGFAGLFKLKLDRWREPVLASSTDGVGTKIAIAQAMGIHHTIGIDLVAMVVDDLVVCGAEPLFLQDYVAVGKVVPELIEQLVRGIADGCVQAGCALLGGETAEHPGMMTEGDYDLSATGVGVVEADAILGPDRVRPGDVVVAMASSGLHSNGYSLVRKVIPEPELIRRWEEFLTPTTNQYPYLVQMQGHDANHISTITLNNVVFDSLLAANVTPAVASPMGGLNSAPA